MIQINIESIEKNNFSPTLGFLDKDFILFLEQTKFNPKVKHIFRDHGITHYKQDDVLSAVETQAYTTTNKKQGATISSISAIKEKIAPVDNKYIELLYLYPKYEEKYTELYNDLKMIIHNLELKKILDYKKIVELMYDKIFPLIKKAPLIFLAAHEFYEEEDNMLCQVINFFLQNILFTTSLFELDTSKTFVSIEKKIQISLASFLANVGLIPVLQATKKKEIISMLLTPQLRKTIPKLSQKILSDSMFPFSLTQGIVQSKEPFIDLQKQQSGNTYDFLSSDLYQCAFIINTYIFLTGDYTNKRFSPLSTIPMLVKQAGKEFNKKYIEVIIHVLGTSPPGSYVTLKNNTKGMILSPNVKPENYSTLQLLSTSNGLPLATIKVISLESDDFSINSPLSNEERDKLHDYRRSLYKLFS